MRKKVTIVGAGNTGATMALRLASRGYCDIVLQDIIEDMPQGKALDLLEAGPIEGFDCSIIGTNGWDETVNSDVIIITSGVPRKPGMTRDDLLRVNMGIVQSVAENAAKASPDAIIVVFANPMDAMCHVVKDVTGFPKRRIVGQGGVLDTSRFRAFIAQELAVSVREVSAYVLGGHGDTMVPLVRYTTVAGVPVEQLIPADRLAQIVQRARDGGAEIVKLLKTGSAFYAPASATVEMVDAILLDRKRILPCATYLEGEYGVNGLFVGAPVRLGAGGVEQVIEISLTDAERAMLDNSASAVRELVVAMERIKQEARV